MNTYKFEQDWQMAIRPANVQETSEGFLLRNDRDLERQQNIINKLLKVLFLLAFIVISLVFFVAFWWFFLLTGLSIFFFNKNFRNRFKNNFFARLRLLPAEVFLSAYPLRLGEECSLNFRRRLKGNRKTKQPGELTFKIACLERITYQRGSDTEIEINVIWESQPKIYSIPIDVDMFTFKTDFTILNKLPPSFEGKNNQIRWVISVEQNISGIVEQVYSNFVFIVDPVLVK